MTDKCLEHIYKSPIWNWRLYIWFLANNLYHDYRQNNTLAVEVYIRLLQVLILSPMYRIPWFYIPIHQYFFPTTRKVLVFIVLNVVLGILVRVLNQCQCIVYQTKYKRCYTYAFLRANRYKPQDRMALQIFMCKTPIFFRSRWRILVENWWLNKCHPYNCPKTGVVHDEI